MTQVLFFPANKLNASICPIFNGHNAIVSQNTDRLKDGKYELAEMALFKHNVQGTAYLNPFGATLNAENVGYGETLKALHDTGRISFGLYWRSDFWINPQTQTQEQIPDYYLTNWTAAGVAAFANVVLGEPKSVRYPNHGQQMYDISNGAYGYDAASQQSGISQGSETIAHTQQQLNYFKDLANITISSGSYTNGQTLAARILITQMLGLRNSSYSIDGNGNIDYSSMNRFDMISKASTTRAWDAVNSEQFPNQSLALDNLTQEIQRAIVQSGWFSDFMHWHSLYERIPNDVAFFDPFFAAINTAIGEADVWRAGNNEAYEYFALAQSINKIGSYIHGNAAFVSLRFADAFIGSNTDGIPNNIDPLQIQTPISILCDFTGTVFSGKTLTSQQAVHCRNVGNNRWIFNVSPIQSYKNGYLSFKIEEALNQDKTYTTAKPVLGVVESNKISSNLPVKVVVWRKEKNVDDTQYKAVHRSNEFKLETGYVFNISIYSYVIGGITRSRVSSAIEL